MARSSPNLSSAPPLGLTFLARPATQHDIDDDETHDEKEDISEQVEKERDR